MKTQIECEEKFFCTHSEKLISFILNDLQFNIKEKLEEEDIYLKDKDNKYIQQDTCLRLRKTNNSYMELTRKSAINNNECLKKEKNIPFPIKKEKRLLLLLEQIGISAYCKVNKKRTVYTKTKENLTFNIALDIINNKTEFIELEIISLNYQNDLNIKLDEFISFFKDFNLKKANTNYRDFCLKQIKS